MPLVPCITNSAPATSLYAPVGSGGGGGGGGPNPVVSTLTTNAGWNQGFPSTFDIVGAGIGLAIGGDNVQAVAIGGSTLQEVGILGANLSAVLTSGGQLGSVRWESGRTNPDYSDMSLNISTGQTYFNNLLPNGTFLEIQSDITNPTPTQAVCGSLELGALPDGRSYVGAALGYSVSSLSTLLLLGDGVNISSLNVSSINGVVPGGAVIPGDLTLSTLTMGIPGGITGISTLEGATGVLPIVGSLSVQEIKGVSSINGAVYPPPGGGSPPAETSTILALTNLSSINNGTPQLLLVAGDLGITGGYLAASAVSTNTITPLTGTKITLSAPLVDTTGGNLAVSSINGAAYPPVAGGLQFSTIGIPGGAGLSTFVCDPNATAQLVSFSTTAGHVYTASVGARAQVFVTAANGDTIYTEIFDNNTGNDAIGNWSAQMVSTIAAGGSYQYVGGSITWKAGGTGASFSCNPSVSTNIRVDSVNVIDYGAI